MSTLLFPNNCSLLVAAVLLVCRSPGSSQGIDRRARTSTNRSARAVQRVKPDQPNVVHIDSGDERPVTLELCAMLLEHLRHFVGVNAEQFGKVDMADRSSPSGSV
jgi:hypothetical protein